jgi:hypothetical protein
VSERARRVGRLLPWLPSPAGSTPGEGRGGVGKGGCGEGGVGARARTRVEGEESDAAMSGGFTPSGWTPADRVTTPHHGPGAGALLRRRDVRR